MDRTSLVLLGRVQSGSLSYGKGLGAGKVAMQDFNFVMKANKAGPKLFEACAERRAHQQAILTARKAGKTSRTS